MYLQINHTIDIRYYNTRTARQKVLILNISKDFSIK